MAVQYPDPQVTATSNIKSLKVKSIRLLFSDFTTGPAASVKAILPSDASIMAFGVWTKTKLSGGSISAGTLSIGVAGAATQFVNALDALTPNSGAFAFVAAVSNTHQAYAAPGGGDISLLFTGTATTGNPTAGEIYVDIYYVE
jgi:hypothetical protein